MIRATFLLAFALCACSGGPQRLSSSAARSGPAAPINPDEPSEVAARLQGATYGRSPGQPVNCVPLAELGGNRALSRDILLFQGQQGRLYVNRVRSCPGLRYEGAVLLGPGGAELCSGEVVQAVAPGSRTPLGPCTLGPFLPYNPQG